MNEAASSYRPAGSLPSDPLGAFSGCLNARQAAHLLRRAGFGGSPADVARYTGMPAGDAVETFIRFPDTSNYALPQLVDGQNPVPGAGADPDARKVLRMARREQTIANAVWWIERMIATSAPLQEKMTLFLHGHFATAANAKGIYGLEIVDQNQLFRSYALGNWRALTHYVTRDVAMLRWLDNARSVKAHPNENYARELMELFTLGIGNYTETDVRESARAFTGYTFARRTGQFYFNAAQHDDGSKTFLGHIGNFNGDDIVDIIFSKAAAATFFATKLLAFFVYSDPEPELVATTAALIRKNDFTMAPVMSALLRSNVFFSDRAYRALVKTPVEFVVGSYRLFGATDVKPDVLVALGRMGQIPFRPPSVKGWDGGATWLNTQTVLARENFASALVASGGGMQSSWLTASLPASAADGARRLVDGIVQGDASPAAQTDLANYLDGVGTSTGGALSGENFEERMHGAAYLTMAMPAYQLA